MLGGLQKIFTNFGAMSGQLSGPVAIVAAGSEVGAGVTAQRHTNNN